MSSKTRTDDLWKKLNQACRADAALSASINNDAYVRILIASLNAMLLTFDARAQTAIPKIEFAVPMPRALYFGDPCPFLGEALTARAEAEMILQEWESIVQPFRDLANELLHIPAWLQNALLWLQGMDDRFTLEVLTGAQIGRSMCPAWKATCGFLRDRVWTLVRLRRSLHQLDHFRQ